MNILSITHPSTSATHNFARQHQDDTWQARRAGAAERDFGVGYGGRGYASKPDSLRTSRYRDGSTSPRFRIS